MALLETITEDMISAMKRKDSFSLGVIRMAKGAVSLEAINKKRDLTDEEVVDVIVKQIKLRKDAILEFTKANRMDLVSQNEKEIEVLNKYLPEQLSSEEVIQIIDDAFNTLNPTSAKDMGLIMKEVTPRLKGKCDMSMVSSIIKEKLNNIKYIYKHFKNRLCFIDDFSVFFFCQIINRKYLKCVILRMGDSNEFR